MKSIEQREFNQWQDLRTSELHLNFRCLHVYLNLKLSESQSLYLKHKK